MGGHHTKQTLKVTTNVVVNASLKVTQNCISYMDGTQVISIHGSGIVFKGNVQQSQLSVNMKCVDKMNQKGKFENELTNRLTQELKDQEQALTEWMDPNGDDQNTDITQNVTTNITFTDVQNCLATLNGTQLFVVTGSNDVVVDNLQEQTLTLAQQCLMSGGQATDVANNITNVVNQHSNYDSKNPFSFITDALKALVKDLAALAAAIFVAVVVLVLAFKIGTRGGGRRELPAAT